MKLIDAKLNNNEEQCIVAINAYIMKGHSVDLNGNDLNAISDVYYMNAEQNYVYEEHGSVCDAYKVYPLSNNSISSYLNIIDDLVNYHHSFFQEKFDAYFKFPKSGDNNTYLVPNVPGMKSVIRINEEGERFTNPIKYIWW